MKSFGELQKNYSVRKGWIKPVNVTRRYLDKDGYVVIKVRNHFIVGNARLFEHRLVLIEKLGRLLTSKEVAHHAPDKRRRNNHPDNINLIACGEHTAIHNRERKITEASRQKHREAMLGNKNLLGYRHTVASRKKMSVLQKGHPPTFTGRKI